MHIIALISIAFIAYWIIEGLIVRFNEPRIALANLEIAKFNQEAAIRNQPAEIAELKARIAELEAAKSAPVKQVVKQVEPVDPWAPTCFMQNPCQRELTVKQERLLGRNI